VELVEAESTSTFILHPRRGYLEGISHETERLPVLATERLQQSLGLTLFEQSGFWDRPTGNAPIVKENTPAKHVIHHSGILVHACGVLMLAICEYNDRVKLNATIGETSP
jgi:hypothetical protein